MDNKDNDIFYVIEEEEPETGETQGAPSDDDGKDAQEPQEPGKAEGRKVRSPWNLLWNVLTRPAAGWRELKRSRISVDELARQCFYPLTALAAVSQFAAVYYSGISITDALRAALAAFLAYFAGYFGVLSIAGLLMPKNVKDGTDRLYGKQMTMMAMATLALFHTVYSVLPMLDAVLVFLPLYTAYLVFKGVKLMRIAPDMELRGTCVMELLIIGVPVLIFMLMTAVLQ